MLSQSLTKSASYFMVLEAAVQAGIPQLQDNVIDKICSRFNHAVTADSQGWNALSQEAVMLVLCSNKLQVHSFASTL